MKTSLHTQVSELVMGWKPGLDGSIGVYWWVAPGRKGICEGNPYSQRQRPCSTWNPTKDVNHALEVVAAMYRRGFQFMASTTNQGTWEAHFLSKTCDGYAARDASLAKSICIAARNAVQ